MKRLRKHASLVSCLLCLTVASPPSLIRGAQVNLQADVESQPAEQPEQPEMGFSTAIDEDPAGTLERAEALILGGLYDDAVPMLKALVGLSDSAPEIRWSAYLLLIRSLVFLGNHHKLKPDGRQASQLFYEEARRTIVECLGIAEFRHVEPDPSTGDPRKMVELFADVRREIFGSLRITELSPSDAVVVFRGDTLHAHPLSGVIEEIDVPVGTHPLDVYHDDFPVLHVDVLISPNTVVERPVALEKKRNPLWIGLALAAAAGAGVVAAVLGGSAGSGSDEPPDPLPEPDPPPGF